MTITTTAPLWFSLFVDYNILSISNQEWHPGMGSNHERQSQSLLCYHYTTREQICGLPFNVRRVQRRGLCC